MLVGDRNDAEFLGHVRPDNYENKQFQRTFKKSNKMEDVTIFLPRNEVVENIEIVVDEAARVESPTPYKDIKPILYYGPSITEAGNCMTGFTAYPAIISARLNIDVYNMGFAGCALGEAEVAEYIKNIEMSMFVYEYEYNAPTVEHLENTHKPFFDIIRKANPTLPILITTFQNINITMMIMPDGMLLKELMILRFQTETSTFIFSMVRILSAQKTVCYALWMKFTQTI